MAKKTIKTRIQTKNDIKANWDQAQNFKPLKGEMILYTDTKQMKVGDGETLVSALPFYPSGDVTAAGNNTFTGTNTFGSGNLQVGDDSTHIILNDNGIESGGLRLLMNSPSTGTFNYKFPCNKTVDESPANIVTENENNTFSGTNTFTDTVTFNMPAAPFKATQDGKLACTNGLELDFSQSTIKFRDTARLTYGTVIQADTSVHSHSADVILTLPNITGTIVADSTDNTFTRPNKFKETYVTFTSPSPNQTTTINAESVKVDNGENAGNSSATLSASQLRLYNGGAETQYKMESICFDGHTFNYPSKEGTFALTSDVSDYVQANPTANSTTSLTKLKVGNTVYGLPSGGSSAIIISKMIANYPTASSPNASISFTTEENNQISNKDTFDDVIIQVKISDKKYVCLYPVKYDDIIYYFASSDNAYKLNITGGVGQLNYSQPAEIAGSNIFTGTNTFTGDIGLQNNVPTQNTIYNINKNGFKVADSNASMYTVGFDSSTFGNGTSAKYSLATLQGDQTFTGDNTFTGEQTFNQAVYFETTPSVNSEVGLEISPVGTTYTAKINVDKNTLIDGGANIALEIVSGGRIATREWVTALFSYANNTLTINI